MSVIDKTVLREAPVQSDPFDHLIAPGLVCGEHLAAVHRDFPKMDSPGSVPLLVLKYGPILEYQKRNTSWTIHLWKITMNRSEMLTTNQSRCN